MEDLATIRRIKLEQCVQLATFQTDATQVETILYAKHCLDFVKTLDQGPFASFNNIYLILESPIVCIVKLTVELAR